MPSAPHRSTVVDGRRAPGGRHARYRGMAADMVKLLTPRRAPVTCAGALAVLVHRLTGAQRPRHRAMARGIWPGPPVRWERHRCFTPAVS
ncbi:hypothetical protein KL953_15650 [Mycolicibacterium goodii]|uniref:hypothetical protein n=1 Tax=Mycolicibacterium goodii TaxID=134601 RepID=UPI001BDD143E|nr:hypothetical protein [Mycolicibacterium goodii]MBU8810319.1 hypothetical protein [Mycolicibacterium goodii]